MPPQRATQNLAPPTTRTRAAASGDRTLLQEPDSRETGESCRSSAHGVFVAWLQIHCQQWVVHPSQINSSWDSVHDSTDH